MDILIPISIGFFVNLLVFGTSKTFKNSNLISLQMSLFAFLAVLLASFIVGAWVGMGMAVISSGMLIFVLIASPIMTQREWKERDK